MRLQGWRSSPVATRPLTRDGYERSATSPPRHPYTPCSPRSEAAFTHGPRREEHCQTPLKVSEFSMLAVCIEFLRQNRPGSLA
jgi:hypothetical protein